MTKYTEPPRHHYISGDDIYDKLAEVHSDVNSDIDNYVNEYEAFLISKGWVKVSGSHFIDDCFYHPDHWQSVPDNTPVCFAVHQEGIGCVIPKTKEARKFIEELTGDPWPTK